MQNLSNNHNLEKIIVGGLKNIILTASVSFILGCLPDLEAERNKEYFTRMTIERQIRREMYNNNLKEMQKKNELAIIENQRLGFITGTVYKISHEQMSNADGKSKGSLSGHIVGGVGFRGEISGDSSGYYKAIGENAYMFGLDLEDGRKVGLYVINAGDKKTGAISVLTEPGSKMVFPAGTLDYCDKVFGPQYATEETRFDKDTQIGVKRADRVRVFEDKVMKIKKE